MKFHCKFADAFRDPTTWAQISTLLFAGLAQAPAEWAKYCWAGAIVSGVFGAAAKSGAKEG